MLKCYCLCACVIPVWETQWRLALLRVRNVRHTVTSDDEFKFSHGTQVRPTWKSTQTLRRHKTPNANIV